MWGADIIISSRFVVHLKPFEFRVSSLGFTVPARGLELRVWGGGLHKDSALFAKVLGLTVRGLCRDLKLSVVG